MKQRIFNGLLKKRLQKLMCFILVAACIIGTMNIPVLAAYTATTLDLTNGESISFTTSYSDYNYKISKTDLVNYIQNIPDENIKKNDLGIDKSTFDLSQIDDVRFDYKFNSLFTGISALNNLPDNAWYDKLNTYYDDYFVFRFDDYGSTNYYYDNAYFTTYNEATKSLCDVNFYTDENGKKILAFDLYWEYEEVELNTDKVLFTVDTFDNKNIKIKKSNFLALYNKYSDIQMDIDDISACSLHLYQNVGNPVGIRDVEAIIGDDEYFYFDLGYDYDYYGGNDPEDFKPARIVGMYSNINPVINNYPDGNGKYDINLHLTYVDETYAINDFMGQEINGILNLSHDAGKTIKGNKLTILETDNAEDFDYSFNSSYGENKNTKILIKHNGEVISTINPISTYDSNDFIHDGTKAYFGVIRLDGAACGEESVLLALPSTYEDYTYTGYDIEIETNEWGYDEKVFYLNFDVKTDHKYDEPTAKWTDDKCNFEFDCNYGDSNCTKTEVLPGQVSEKERKEPTCDQDGYIIYTAVCDTTNHEFENGIHECTTNHIHTSDSDPIVLPKTGHTAGEANRENEINPTCVDDGSYDLVTRCTKCNEIMSSEHKIVPALGHTWDDDDWTLVDSSEVTNELLANAENASSLKYEERCKVYKHYCTRYHDAYQLLIEPHKHTAGDAKRENEVNPTCVDDGSYDLVTRCVECNEIMSSEHKIVPALGHTWDDEDWTLVDSSKVTNELLQNAENASSLKYEERCKVYRHYCTRYHDAYELLIVPHKHTAGEANRENEINPTCVDDGSYDLVTRCIECNEIMSSEHKIVPALGHTWDDEDWTLVDSSKVTDELLANAENSTSLKYEDKCKVYRHYCTRYHDAYQLLIAPHQHTAGDAKRENEVNPTCVKDGSYDLVTRCTECNEIMSSEHVIVPALGHIWNNEDWTLLDSSEVTDELLQNAENANDLQYEERCKVYRHYCTRYHDAYELLIVPHQHTAGDAKRENEVNPTCVDDGSYDLVTRCTECNEIMNSKHVIVPALGHIWDDEDWTLLDSLEVTDELLQNAENASSLKYEDKCKVYRHYCTRYHDAYELLIVSHEHELGDCVIENKVDPTCTKDGGYDRVFYCKDCGEELQRDHIVLPKLGHEFGDWYVTKEPTYDEIGIKKHDCIRGDYSETSDIDKLTVQAVIKGTVKDSNGNLFKDATIELENGFKTTTDNNGYFEFKDVEAGTYTLKIKAENSASEFKITIQSPKSVVETTLETDCTTNYNVSNFDVEVNMLLNAKKQPEVIIEDKPKTEQIEKIEIEEIKTEKPVVEELKEIEELVEEKKEEKKEESTEKTEEKPVTDNKPQTGDDNSIYLFILLALLSGNWLVISYLLKKNKKY